jgi:hypothetical protein
VWLRFRFHDPTESKARDICRLVATVMLEALKDPDVQRYGIVVIQVRSSFFSVFRSPEESATESALKTVLMPILCTDSDCMRSS